MTAKPRQGPIGKLAFRPLERVRRSFTSNVPSKAAALVLAVILYAYVYRQITETRSIDLLLVKNQEETKQESTILIQEPPDAFIVLPDRPVSIFLTGPKAEVERYGAGKVLHGTVTRERLLQFVPNENEKSREASFGLSDIQFDLPPELSISFDSSAIISLTVDRKKAWTLDVKCRVEPVPGIQADYKVWLDAICDPPILEVNGPAGLSETLKDLVLDPIQLRSPEQEPTTINDVRIRQKLRMLGLESRATQPQPVKISYRIEKRPIQRRMSLPLFLLVPRNHPANSLKITVNGRAVTEATDTVDVELSGPQRELDNLRPQESGIRTFIDVAEFLDQKVKFAKVPLQAMGLPDGVTLGNNEAEVSRE